MDATVSPVAKPASSKVGWSVLTQLSRLQPHQYRLDELQSFFSTVGVLVQVVPEGVELKPPTQNVPKFGHNPSLCQTKKYLDYLYQMKDDFEEEEDDEPLQNEANIGSMWSSSESSHDANVLHSDGAWQ